MAEAVIHHRLDLVVRLIDTATGQEINESGVSFMKNGEKIPMIARGSGTHIGINIGRDDFDLTVNVRGYEIGSKRVVYSEINEGMPMLDVYLLPEDKVVMTGKYRMISGNLPDIRDLEAVAVRTANCCFRDFDERKRIMGVFNPHNVSLNDVHYGLINQTEGTYEKFSILNQKSMTEIKIDHVLEGKTVTNSPIERIVFGRVTPDGDYKLCVRDDARILKYLVRFIVNGEVHFQLIDFRGEPEQMKLGVEVE